MKKGGCGQKTRALYDKLNEERRCLYLCIRAKPTARLRQSRSFPSNRHKHEQHTERRLDGVSLGNQILLFEEKRTFCDGDAPHVDRIPTDLQTRKWSGSRGDLVPDAFQMLQYLTFGSERQGTLWWSQLGTVGGDGSHWEFFSFYPHRHTSTMLLAGTNSCVLCMSNVYSSNYVKRILCCIN